MERLLLLFSDMNYGRVDSLMRDFEQNKSLIIPEDLKGEVTYLDNNVNTTLHLIMIYLNFQIWVWSASYLT